MTKPDAEEANAAFEALSTQPRGDWGDVMFVPVDDDNDDDEEADDDADGPQ